MTLGLISESDMFWKKGERLAHPRRVNIFYIRYIIQMVREFLKAFCYT